VVRRSMLDRPTRPMLPRGSAAVNKNLWHVT
jgi:hypothetical protein